MTRKPFPLRLFDPDASLADDPAIASGAILAAELPEISKPGDRILGQDLEIILAAWHSATERLQRTHQVLCSEVRRLTNELEAKNRELVRRNRLADLGQMASHVAHEVRNELAPVTLYLSLLRRRMRDDPDCLRILDQLEKGFTSLDATVNDMLSFTSDRQPIWRRFVLNDLVTEVCDLLAPQIAAHTLRTELQMARDMAVWADRDLLRRALVNLVLNAVDVMPGGGEVWITAAQDAAGFELEVADSGPGIPEGLASRIFEPFFTTKCEGAGLGLAIVYRVAEAHGGHVRVANCAEGGAAFTLRIPRQPLQEAA